MISSHASRITLAALLSALGATQPLACGGSENEVATSASSTTTGAGGSTAMASSSSATAGTGGSGGAGKDHGHPSDVYPAFHPSAPQIAKVAGSILATPKVVPVLFNADDGMLTGKLSDFLDAVGASTYWSATTAEYGVGPLASVAPVHLDDALPAAQDDTVLSAWLAAKLNADDAALPAADGATIYLLALPSGKSVTLNGETSCVQFGGYHGSTKLDAKHKGVLVPYVVVPRCAGYKGFGPIDALTAVASHELVETVLDPEPFDDPAYRVLDGAHGYWIWATGGESADMCSPRSDAYAKFPGLDFNVARSWSNKSALALHDPCVPVVGTDSYFNTAPVLPDTHSFSLAGIKYKAEVVRIAVGETRDVELDLWSDATTSGPWTVTVEDYATVHGAAPELDIVLDRDSGVNGEKVYATITALKGASGAHGAMSFFLIRSTLGSKKTLWVGAVANK